MAEIKRNIEVDVTTPQGITIPLVRGDFFGVSNIFRICFEIFLSITTALLGVILSLGQEIPTVYKVFIAVTGFTAVAFLGLTIYYYNKAHFTSCKKDAGNQGADDDNVGLYATYPASSFNNPQNLRVYVSNPDELAVNKKDSKKKK